jgi:hypothetical protein
MKHSPVLKESELKLYVGIVVVVLSNFELTVVKLIWLHLRQHTKFCHRNPVAYSNHIIYRYLDTGNKTQNNISINIIMQIQPKGR